MLGPLAHKKSKQEEIMEVDEIVLPPNEKEKDEESKERRDKGEESTHSPEKVHQDIEKLEQSLEEEQPRS